MSFKRQKPELGQESVWDYPRPPRIEPVPERLKVIFNGRVVADSAKGYRILETSHPPTYYIPREDINEEFLRPAAGQTFCEWKGRASYFDVVVEGREAIRVAWSYPSPTIPFLAIKGSVSFYAEPMDACYVGEEQVRPQPGNFYGGWVTSKVVGPFKGGPGTKGW